MHDISMEDVVETIKNTVPEASRWEQLAEECCELAKAALKKARKLRDENMTPLTMKQIDSAIKEEFTDVSVCAKSLDISISKRLMMQKLNRWVDRNSKKD